MIAYRIADARHTIFDATGAARHGGRWNSPGVPAIYAAETFALALLEILVHANTTHPPKNHAVVTITVPDDLRIETVQKIQIKNWDAPNMVASRVFGDAWLREKRGAVLRVPSVITGDREHNLIFNPAHQDFARVKASGPETVLWDERLLRMAQR
jgi:RES domain-containing protein